MTTIFDRERRLDSGKGWITIPVSDTPSARINPETGMVPRAFYLGVGGTLVLEASDGTIHTNTFAGGAMIDVEVVRVVETGSDADSRNSIIGIR